MPRYGLRKIKAPQYNEGSQTSEALRTRNVVRSYVLRTLYDMVITGGTGAGAVFSDAAYRFLRSVQVIVDSGTVHHVNGHTLGKIVKFFLNEEYSQIDPTDDAAGTETGRESNILIPFFMLASLTPDEFGFPTMLNEPEIVTNWAEAAELFDTDADFTSAEIQNGAPELYERPIYGSRRSPGEFAGLTIKRKELTVSTAGSPEVDLTHLRPGMELRALIVEGFSGGSGGISHDYDDAVVADLRLEINGRDELHEVPFSVLQNENKVQFGLASTETGVAVYDAAENGRTSRTERRAELPIIEDGGDPILHLSTTVPGGDCKVVVTTIAGARGARQLSA